ncbi:MAG: glutaredoxin family protein [Nitrospirae bacterium]|nr:MAG: glutaredoxin family protein [Nitrospirota bacterium]
MKGYLSERGIKYEAYDVSADARAREELQNRYGRLATPTIVIGDEVFVGFRENRDKIEERLREGN